MTVKTMSAMLFFATASIAICFTSYKNFESNSVPMEKQVETDPFDKMMPVVTHKRCANCHPASAIPNQGEDSHPHNFGIQRGDEGHGLAGYECSTCHQDENNDHSGVPGASHWAVAPESMAWEGLTRVEIANNMMNRELNGDRSLDDIVEHLTEHELVIWAWEPGVDAEGNQREKPPIPKDEYIKAVKDWAAVGAEIPVK